MYSGEVPFALVSERAIPRVVVDRGNRPSCPSTLKTDSYIWQLLETCWSATVEIRPSFADIEKTLRYYAKSVAPGKYFLVA